MRVVTVKSVVGALALVLVAGGSNLSAQSGRTAGGNTSQGAVARFGVPQVQASGDEVEGVLEVTVEDHVDNKTAVNHFLNTASGRIRLREAPGRSDLAGLITGERIRVRGRRMQDGSIELQMGGTTSASTGGGTIALASPNTFGVQRVVVIMVNFSDDQSQPYSWAHVADVTFNQVNNFFLENSYGQTSLTGDVLGWFTIPMSSGSCDYNQIASLADQAASNSGANLNNYTRRVYAFPRNACAWWGLGTVGGNPSRAWIKGTYAQKVVAHELGHNLGDWHSNSQPCESGGCSTTEYGDDRDTMGGQGVGHFNAFQKERLGWLNYGNSPAIQSIGATGTYWISSLQDGSAGPKALKVLKAPSSSGNTNYYIEMRTQSGADYNYAPGVVIHTGNETNGNSSYQIDMDPFSAYFDSILDPGQTFTDSGANVTVTTMSVESTGAWVRVEVAGQPCSARTPTVSLSPGNSSTEPGVGTSYSVSIKNNDDATCAAADFGVNMSVPAGWDWTPSVWALSVAPGQTKSLSVSVTPPSTASGSNTISSLMARSSGGPGGSATATLTVTTSTVAPPPPPASAITMSLAVTGGSNYQIKATVMTNVGPAVGAAVRLTVLNPRGSVEKILTGTTGSTGEVTFKGKLNGRDPRGTYSVGGTATLSSLTASATATWVF